MKKVLLVCDGNHFPFGAFELVKDLNTFSPVFLKGIFLSTAQYTNLWAYPVHSANRFPATRHIDAHAPAGKIEVFTGLCKKNNISCTTQHYNENLVLSALRKECRFADLLVMSGEQFYNNLNAPQPNSFTKTILHKAECPVLLAPEEVHTPASIILSYDGSAASVFAIKQFSYLFPGWCGLETLLAYESTEQEPVPDLNNIEELASHHFSNVMPVAVSGAHGANFTTWAEQKKNSLVVGGPFGRTAASSLFKKSFLTGIVQHHKMPVFTAHK